MGLIHLYCGNGKGKTTAAMGLAIRCAGAGKKVLVIQFLKDNSSSERKILEGISNIDVVDGRDCEKFVFAMNENEKKQTSQYCTEQLGRFFEKAAGYDMLVLDEVAVAVGCGLIDEEYLIGLLKNCNAEVVMTGGTVSDAMLEICDYITEMKKIKHPFDKGIQARKGVEF